MLKRWHKGNNYCDTVFTTKRSGALIGSRYKSKAVEIDEYFIPLIIYIHQNPVRAGIVEQPADYAYSSFQEYMENKELVNTEFALSLIDHADWVELHKRAVEGNFSLSNCVKMT